MKYLFVKTVIQVGTLEFELERYDQRLKLLCVTLPHFPCYVQRCLFYWNINKTLRSVCQSLMLTTFSAIRQEI